MYALDCAATGTGPWSWYSFIKWDKHCFQSAHLSLLSCPWAQQLSRDIPTYVGVLCDKATMLGDSLEGTFCIFVVAHVTWCFTVLVRSGTCTSIITPKHTQLRHFMWHAVAHVVAHYDVYVCVVCSTVIVVDSIHVSTERFVVSDVAIVRNRILNVVDLHMVCGSWRAVAVCVYQSNLWPSWKHIL